MQGPQDASFYAMRGAVEKAIDIIKADPGVQNAMGFTGGQGATNAGFTFIALKPLDQRKHGSAQQIIDRLRPKLARVPGAATYLQPVQDIRIGGRQSNAQYQYTLQAETTEDLQKYGPLLLAQLKHAPGFADVSTDQQNHGLQELLTYDRPTAARLGITPQIHQQHPLRMPSASPRSPPSTPRSTSIMSSWRPRPSTGHRRRDSRTPT